MKSVRLRLGDDTREVRLSDAGEAVLDGRAVAFRRSAEGGGIEGLAIGGRVHRVRAAREGNRVFVWCDGRIFVFDRAPRARAGAAEHGADLIAPMPGRVRRVFVDAGQAVGRGTVLLALEAMKMEHAIRAPRDGVVRRVLVAEGSLVDAGAELVELG
ncbi:MAG TPA: biotin/lipoyl-containing protein [Thermoanaerobaculia bacterium]|nr:biotin/lipoyl-containing protein [Thermoanaerobaculia bacterium]